ncbi:hypothetical protein [Natrialba aegyptia]|nr:hypothetical protein [Natrialba aegyptia]
MSRLPQERAVEAAKGGGETRTPAGGEQRRRLRWVGGEREG